ncbi:MAG: 4Fe-4S binding protein, partial [Oscillibacter sp.]|nr:4Fe-4S binding protein [Oscillibacter sp.]
MSKRFPSGRAGWRNLEVTMQATVNENCISCGLCVESCPTVFSMGGDG